MKIKLKASLFLWVFICIFVVFWVGVDLWSGLYNGEIQDLRTGKKLVFDVRPIWFLVVFVLKALALAACLYFLYGVAQIVRVKLSKARRRKVKGP